MTPRHELTKLSLAQLILAYRISKTQQYIEEVVRRCSPWLLAYITKIAGPVVANDVLQDTWIIALAAIEKGSYKEKQHFDKYIKGIAYKLAVKAWIAEHELEHEEEERIDQNADETLNEEKLLEEIDTNTRFLNGFRRLSLLEKQVVLLARRMNFKEIGQKLHINNARIIHYRALKKLRFYML